MQIEVFLGIKETLTITIVGKFPPHVIVLVSRDRKKENVLAPFPTHKSTHTERSSAWGGRSVMLTLSSWTETGRSLVIIQRLDDICSEEGISQMGLSHKVVFFNLGAS